MYLLNMEVQQPDYAAGVYTVNISDAMGCMTTAIVIITEPAAPITLSATVTQISCNGACDGAIDLHVSWRYASVYLYLG